MTPAERIVLLAATTAPLYPAEGRWVRTDGPGWLPRLPVRPSDVEQLLTRGLLRGSRTGAAVLTPAGLDEAQTLRGVLGAETRRLLRQIDEAGELVRRERLATEEEFCAILASGGAPTGTLVEWVAPSRGSRLSYGEPHSPYPVPICDSVTMAQLVERGLVVVIAGGTRAVITGAGRWCAEEVDHG